MKIIVLIVFYVLSVLSASAAPAEKRIALVIGNSSYTNIPALPNPKNDAALMAATLKDVGFTVISAIDVDYQGMRRAVKKFGQKLRSSGKDTVGLFYYAGHGVQAKGANYLIPLGSEIETQSDLNLEALEAGDILEQMEDAGNALNLVILDACRNNPYKGSVRSSNGGLARINAASGSLIAFAAGPGQVAADGTGANSPYTKALVEAIRQPGLSVEQVFKRTRVSVRNQTGNKQTPWEESSLEGDFYFVPITATITNNYISQSQPPASAIKTTDADRETLFWESIKDSKNPKMLAEYIKTYPKGTFSGLATVMIQDLQTTKQASEHPQKLAEFAALPDSIPAEPTPAQDMDKGELTLALQRKLKTAKCYKGKIDGVWGSGSQSALERFAKAIGAAGRYAAASQDALILIQRNSRVECPGFDPHKDKKEPTQKKKSKVATRGQNLGACIARWRQDCVNNISKANRQICYDSPSIAGWRAWCKKYPSRKPDGQPW